MRFSSITKRQFLLCVGLLLPLLSLKAQNNQVITGPASTTPGTLNTIIRLNYGVNQSQEDALTGTENILIGNGAGAAYRGMTNRSTIVGSRAGAYTQRSQLATTQDNTLLGATAGQVLVGSYNTFTGSGAGAMVAPGQGAPVNSGGYNTFNGYQAGYANQGGSNNSYMGSNAGYSTTNGSSNVSIGVSAAYLNQTGFKNVMIGDSAGYSNTVSGNVFVGSKAGYTNQTGGQNTLLGYQAGLNLTSSANTLIGYRTGSFLTNGQFNTFIGVQAGSNTTSGNSNFIMGTNAGLGNTTGSANFFLGDNAGGVNTTGGFNVYLGANAGNGTGVNGDNNVAIGFESGRANNGGVTNLFLGFRADAGANGLSNATAIGPNAKVTVSNAVVLGSGANVGIGTSSPSTKLHITADQANTSGLRLEKLTSASPASIGQSKFLTVDGVGNVILGTSGSGRSIAVEQWTASGNTLQNANDGAVIIGQGVNNTPTGYKLYVEQGILTERVKVAVKNTSEWSDYVFAPSYKLVPLSQVEAHIQQTGHLPGIPSAQQMVEQGNDLHKTDAKLLEKIEELTLYSIQLEKKSQQQESVNQQQQLTNQKQQAELDELKALVKQLLEKK